MVNDETDYDTDMRKRLIRVEQKHLEKEFPKFYSIHISKVGIQFNCDKYGNDSVLVWINKNTNLYNSGLTTIEDTPVTILNSKSIKQAVNRVITTFGTNMQKETGEPANIVINGLFV